MKKCDLHTKSTKVFLGEDHQCIHLCYWVGLPLNCACYPIGCCTIDQVKLVTRSVYKQVDLV